MSRVRTGMPNNQLGLKRSAITIAKLKSAHLGKKRPEVSGAKHGNWRGGITSEDMRIRKSIEMFQFIDFVKKRDDYRCYDCGEKNSKLAVHHIYSFSQFPRLRFMLENAITLCQECHRKTDNYGSKSIKGRQLQFAS